MSDYIFSARNIQNNAFDNDVDNTIHYLLIPDNALDYTPDNIIAQDEWVNAVVDENELTEDILIYIHGYNDTRNDILKNHRSLKYGLQKQGFNGQVISFDWPCGNQALMYLPDRHKAVLTSLQLVNGIKILSERQKSGNCYINIHVLAHSTGAFVVREAFEDAENSNNLPTQGWMVTQLIFISGDISSNSMKTHCRCDAIYEHCIRFTNYYNPYDAALAMSNLKRAGFEDRVGRIGLPIDVPDKCIDVDCGPYYDTIREGKPLFYSHSWYFDDNVNLIFIEDLNYTIQGNIDRNYIPTRKMINGTLTLANKA